MRATKIALLCFLLLFFGWVSARTILITTVRYKYEEYLATHEAKLYISDISIVKLHEVAQEQPLELGANEKWEDWALNATITAPVQDSLPTYFEGVRIFYYLSSDRMEVIEDHITVEVTEDSSSANKEQEESNSNLAEESSHRCGSHYHDNNDDHHHHHHHHHDTPDEDSDRDVVTDNDNKNSPSNEGEDSDRPHPEYQHKQHSKDNHRGGWDQGHHGQKGDDRHHDHHHHHDQEGGEVNKDESEEPHHRCGHHGGWRHGHHHHEQEGSDDETPYHNEEGSVSDDTKKEHTTRTMYNIVPEDSFKIILVCLCILFMTFIWSCCKMKQTEDQYQLITNPMNNTQISVSVAADTEVIDDDIAVNNVSVNIDDDMTYDYFHNDSYHQQPVYSTVFSIPSSMPPPIIQHSYMSAIPQQNAVYTVFYQPPKSVE